MSWSLPKYCYVVVVEIRTPGHDYSGLWYELQQRSVDWCHYLSNTFLIVRTEAAAELQTKLVGYITQQDLMLILPAKRPAAGFLPQEAWNWINERLPIDDATPASPPGWVPPVYVPQAPLTQPPKWQPPSDVTEFLRKLFGQRNE